MYMPSSTGPEQKQHIPIAHNMTLDIAHNTTVHVHVHTTVCVPSHVGELQKRTHSGRAQCRVCKSCTLKANATKWHTKAQQCTAMPVLWSVQHACQCCGMCNTHASAVECATRMLAVHLGNTEDS